MCFIVEALQDKAFDFSTQAEITEDGNYRIICMVQISLLGVVIPFSEIPTPTEILPRSTLNQVKIHAAYAKYNKKMESQVAVYNEIAHIQKFLVSKGCFYPATNDYLLAYGYKQIIIGEGCI